jgi:hypothetical protein
VLGPSAEHEKSQKIIQTLTAALIIAPGIERRFNFSRIPAALVLLGDALVAVGYYIVFLALRENRWAASSIEVRPGQSVIPPDLPHRPPSDVFGRCVDDSCHAAGLGLALGLRVRGLALRHHRGAGPRRGAVSLEDLASIKPDCRIRDGCPS